MEVVMTICSESWLYTQNNKNYYQNGSIDDNIVVTVMIIIINNTSVTVPFFVALLLTPPSTTPYNTENLTHKKLTADRVVTTAPVVSTYKQRVVSRAARMIRVPRWCCSDPRGWPWVLWVCGRRGVAKGGSVEKERRGKMIFQPTRNERNIHINNCQRGEEGRR